MEFKLNIGALTGGDAQVDGHAFKTTEALDQYNERAEENKKTWTTANEQADVDYPRNPGYSPSPSAIDYRPWLDKILEMQGFMGKIES